LPRSRNPEVLQSAVGQQRPFLVRHTVGPRLGFELLPGVPVLPVTVLRLDLLLGQPSLDLHAIAGVVLSDLGATLQVLRLADRCVVDHDQQLGHISDCIVHLGQAGLRRAVSSRLLHRNEMRNPNIRQIWRRARIAAGLAQTIAAQFADVSPANAYLAGLLHEIGCLPMLLGWTVEGVNPADAQAVGSALVREWGLPEFLAYTLPGSSDKGQSSSALHQIVTAAWGLADTIATADDGSGRTSPGDRGGPDTEPASLLKAGQSWRWPYRPVPIP
jgi:HD-like signal output (HDOD) protein